MLTALVALTLSCKMVAPVVQTPTTSRCEGADLVLRDHDRREVRRQVNACLSRSCEGPDLVSRDSGGVEFGRSRFAAQCVVTRCQGVDLVRVDHRGVEFSRQPFAPSCAVSRCEGSDFVTRDRQGFERSRASFDERCAPPVRLTRAEGWRFGLSAR
ncbi:MAG: hypothetical protein SFW67_15025 [Myxococcaceae bacterium]|nr:hypothetical protein [Myxococcaceae bacterium]